MKQTSISVEEPNARGNAVGLFDDICYYDSGNKLKFGHVIRIRKKKSTAGYVEYIRPVSLSNPDKCIHLTSQIYIPEVSEPSNYRFKLSDERHCLSLDDVYKSVSFKYVNEKYILLDIDLLRKKNDNHSDQNIDKKEERIIETHISRSGWIRNVIRYAFK